MAQRRNHRRREQKKGVVLLIIVTLLTLFIMIGITLSLLASGYKGASEQSRFAGTYGDLPEKEMDLVLGQLLYGSPTVTAASPHNLLADLYGNDGVAGTVSAYQEDNGNQVIQITYQQSAQQPFGQSFSAVSHYYAGRVLTFTDGNAAGFSTRVLAYVPTTGAPQTGTLFVEALEGDLPVKVLPSNGSRFLINGAPFNGAGFGFEQSTYNIDQQFNGYSVGLMPNFAGYSGTTAQAVNLAGEDEPWDAPDLNNIALAHVPSGLGVDTSLPILPSFHRPELINYWANEPNVMAGGNWQSIPLNLLRQISLRPIGAEYTTGNPDHPNFTGSNPNYHPINGPWDVDNDGDGIADSVWIDTGLPIVTGKDGRKYKRLVAFLVKDLDGRINVNVHGNLSQLVAQFRADQGTNQFGLYTGAPNLLRGTGYGVGEIDFLGLFGNFTTPNDQTAYSTLLRQRYGNDNLPGTANTRDPFNIVKHHGTPNDYANTVMGWASPPDVWGRGAIALDSAGTPLTLYMGQTGEMLDNPYEIHVGRHGLAADAPYTIAEMEPLLRYHDPGAGGLASRLYNSGSAQPYLNQSSRGVLGTDHTRRESLTVASRHVPAPMARMPREFFNPDPSQQTKPGLINAFQYIQGKRSATLLDLYVYKLLRDGAAANIGDPALATAINAIVPWEIRHGQLFDLNRFLGDGFDNNNDGIADDYNEAFGGETAWLNVGQVPATFQGATAWHTNDVDFNGDGNYNGFDFVFARQLYARHLFCLMMLLMDDGYQPPFLEPGLSITDQRELVVRKVAQWAINVVDFRDSDAVMSAFEYDVNPFNGWQVDGNLGTDGNANPEQIYVNGMLTAVNTPDRRVCWGVEFPDLVLQETFATHDRRTRDTNYDTMMRFIDGGDPHPDQIRLPQGSLFVELYCPRPKQNNNPRLPRELYAQDPMTGQWRLAIQKLSPLPSADGTQRPVWRLAISDHVPNLTNGSDVPWLRQTTNYDSTSFEPQNMSFLPSAMTTPQIPIDRYVWFSNIDPPPMATPEYGRTFVNSVGWDVSLEPGQYAVVGPRAATYMGSATDGDPVTTFDDGDSTQGVILGQINPPPGGNGVVVTGLGGMPLYAPGAGVKNVVGIIADMQPPLAWLNQAKRIGLNITEPLPLLAGVNVYAEPTSARDGYDDLSMPVGTFIDEPFDRRAGYPLADWGMYSTGTYPNVRAVFLQRLADPNAAWHPQYNPYVTIDWASTDVTVFTGEDTPSVPTTGGMDRDPDDMWDPVTSQLQFHSRQKGVNIPPNTFGTIPNVSVNLWTNNWPAPPNTPPSAAGTTFFDYDFVVDTTTGMARSTLGYLNRNLGTPQPDNMATPQSELGDPAEGPFPWLAHLDRPLTSPAELLMIPAWSQARLMHEFQPLGQPGTPRGVNPYTLGAPGFGAPFTQLVNFYQTGDPVLHNSPQFTRIFDYVEVPSAYSGTEKWFNPQVFGIPTAPNTLDAAITFRPPFNKLSRFADPGRINLNTVDIYYNSGTAQWESPVLQAALQGIDPTGNNIAAVVQRIAQSRQGYTMNPNSYPTRFANPFRPADAADLMPNVGNMRRAPAEATFLRSWEVDSTTPNPRPLFDLDVGATPIYNYNDPNRNVYFEFQEQQKLGNVFSTQSNVYAIWLTVGYFEVEQNPAGVNAAHPDGYRLGQEVGADSGGVTRHRSFYIIDRSIPVAYEPGKRHNADKMVLLRRFIE